MKLAGWREPWQQLIHVDSISELLGILLVLWPDSIKWLRDVDVCPMVCFGNGEKMMNNRNYLDYINLAEWSVMQGKALSRKLGQRSSPSPWVNVCGRQRALGMASEHRLLGLMRVNDS